MAHTTFNIKIDNTIDSLEFVDGNTSVNLFASFGNTLPSFAAWAPAGGPPKIQLAFDCYINAITSEVMNNGVGLSTVKGFYIATAMDGSSTSMIMLGEDGVTFTDFGDGSDAGFSASFDQTTGLLLVTVTFPPTIDPVTGNAI